MNLHRGAVVLALAAVVLAPGLVAGAGPDGATTPGPSVGTASSVQGLDGADQSPARRPGDHVASGAVGNDPHRLAADAPATDTTVVDIEVYGNGSATWELRVRTRLRTESDVEEYRRFQDEFRNDTASYLDPFRDRMTGVVAGAENATGRQMNATDFAASTRIQEVPRRWGVVAFQFRWEGFANVTGDRVAVGDAFEGGLFLSENDSLQVTGPAGYDVATSDPSPDDVDGRTLTWFGRADFDDRRPRAVFERSATTDSPGEATTTPGETTGGTTGPTTSEAAGDGTSNPATGGGEDPTVLLGGLLLVAVVGAGVLAVGLRRRAPGTVGPDASEPADDAAGDEAGSSSAGDAAPGDRTGTEAAAGAGTDDQGSDGTAPVAESDLLPDEEKVRRLIAHRGGRMKQADVAEELDWSASKTSRVLSKMADDGSVEKLRIGRQNLIDLVESSSDGDGAGDATER